MPESRLYSLSRWLLGADGDLIFERDIQLVTVVTAIGVSGIFVVSPILSALTGTFGVSESDIGLLMTLFTAPSILLVPVMGMLADRIGRRPVLTGGLLVFGVAGTGIGFVNSFQAVLALRIVQGVGYAAIIPLTVTLIGDWYEGSREVTAQGLRIASIQVITLGVPPLAGTLVAVAWHFPFFLYATAIVTSVWVWVTIQPVGVSNDTDLGTYYRDLFALLREPKMSIVVFSFVLRFVLVFGFYTYVSILLAEMGSFSSFASGLVVAFFGLLSLVVSTQVGRITAVRDPWHVLLWGICLSGIGMGLLGLSPTFPVLLSALVVFAAGASLIGPVQKSLTNHLAPQELRAGAISGAIIAQATGQTVGPMGMGMLLSFMSPSATFVVTGFSVAVIGVLLVAVLLVRGDLG